MSELVSPDGRRFSRHRLVNRGFFRRGRGGHGAVMVVVMMVVMMVVIHVLIFASGEEGDGGHGQRENEQCLHRGV